MRRILLLTTLALMLLAVQKLGFAGISEKSRKFNKPERPDGAGHKTEVQAGSGDALSKALLKEMSKYYRSLASMEAQVALEMAGGASQNKEKRKGKLWLKGRKFRIDMGEQLLISDGKISWTYLKQINEVSISNYEPTPDQITPDNLFTLYEKGFDSFMESETGGPQDGIAQIDLIPQNKSVSYFKVRLTVNKGSRQIQKAIVFDKSGVKYTYSITGFKANPVLKEDLFAFNPNSYPGVEVVDMR